MPETLLTPGISVVVCCHNSADVIAPALRALAGQTVPAGSGCEVILVDNLCSDETVTLARETWQQAKARHPLRVVTEETPGLIHARKRGAAEARHDHLFFIDDDNLLTGGALAELLSLYGRQPRATAIGGRIEPLFQGEKPPWFDLVAGTFACTPAGPEADRPGPRRTMSGAGLSFRTAELISLFRSPLPLFLVGRRGEALSRGEDAEICLRLALQGGELRYEPSLHVSHLLRPERLNWDYVLAARHWYGRAEVVLRIYHDGLDRNIPLSYPARLSQLEKKLEGLPPPAGSGRALTDSGLRLALKRNYLLGQRQGLLEMGEEAFAAMRRSVMAAFPSAFPAA